MTSRKCVRRLLFTLLCMAAMLPVTGCGSHPFTSITITAGNAVVAGQTTQLHATATNATHRTSDVTTAATWSSSNPAVATVSSSGLLTGVAPGSATITAVSGKIDGTLAVVIGIPPVSQLTVTPAAASVFTGGTQQYKAVATYTTGGSGDVTSLVTWSASPASVATISSSGLLRAVAAGEYTVQATSGSITGTVTGTVADPALTGITITPTSASIASGSTQQFTATGSYNDQSQKDLTGAVTWTSSDATKLTISSSGLATAASVTATAAVMVTAHTAGLTATAAVKVTPQATVTGLVVKPTSSSIAQGTAQQHTATASYSDGTVQDVTNQVKWGIGDASPSVTRGQGASAHAKPRDGTATVDQDGVAYATQAGATNVIATYGTLQAESVLLVRDITIRSLMIGSRNTSVPVGATQQLTLKGQFSDGSTQDVSLTGNWQSSNPAVATVNARGVATAVSGGDVQFSASFGGITATTGTIKVIATDLVTLTLKVANPVINIGGVEQLSLIGIYADGTTQDLTPLAGWQSSNTAILQVNDSGFLQAVGAGKAQITAKVADFSAVTTIAGVATNLDSIEILPADPDFALGTSLQFTALGHLSNGAQFDITPDVLWTSLDPTVLTINANGLAKSGSIGSTTVTASLEGVSQSSAVAHISNATPTALSIDPPSARLAKTTHAQFNVMGWFSDGTVEDVTDDVLWSIANPAIAAVDSDGTVAGLTAGTTTVAASMQSLSVRAPLTVTNAVLLSTSIVPGNITLPVAVQRQLSLVGNFSDGTTQDMTSEAIWLSPTPSIAFATQTGVGVGLSPGLGNVGAQLGNFTSATQVDVTNATLTAIALTPATASIRERGSQQMTATGTFSDGSQQDLYLNAVFSAANPQVVYLRANGRAIGIGTGSTQITAKFRDLQAGTTSFVVRSGDLRSVALLPANPAVAAGGTTQLTAVGTYADGSTEDLSAQVTWTSSNPAVLSVDAKGLATAHATSSPVTVTVTARMGDITQSFTVTVSPVNPGSVSSLSIQPLIPTVISAGDTRQFSATATYTNGSSADVSGTAVWVSSNPAVATVNLSGLATGAGTGSTIITATQGGVSASTTLTVQTAAAPIATLVSIAVTPAIASIATGASQWYVASGTYSDGTIEDITSKVSWASLRPTVATIDSGGMAVGVSAGTAGITAQRNGVTGSALLMVNTPPPPGGTVTLLTVTPGTATIATHGTQAFSATATFADGTTQNVTTTATWTSSSPAVATINQAGVATGAAAGSTAIGASWGGAAANAALVVTGNNGGGNNPVLTSITVTPASASIAVGATQPYMATGTYSDGSTRNLTTSATWSSASPATASVSSTGVATGMAEGMAVLTAASSGLSSSATLTVTASTATLTSLVVTPTSSQIVAGLSEQFTANGSYSDGSRRDIAASANWSSSNALVATVNSSGLVTGLTPGVATITCTAGTIHSQTTVVIEAATLQSVAISPSGASFAAGATQPLILTGTYSNGSRVDLTTAATWTSLTPQVASVSSSGLVTGVAPGTARISAVVQAQSATTTIAITPATLAAIAVSPTTASFPKGVSRAFTVAGTYSDGTTHDVTSQSAFLSSDASVFSVSAAGIATGVAAGAAHLTVTFGGYSAVTQTITVLPATLVSIAITPANPIFAKGTKQQFTATGTYSDGTAQDLSKQAVWSSSDPQTATINQDGLASSGTPGSTQISATFQGVTGTSGTAQVSSAVLTGLTIAPTTAQIAKGTTQAFTATGTYSDGTTQNLSSTVTWSTSSPTVVSVDANGLATGNGVGSAQVSAAFGASVASTSSFQVTPATLVSITVTPGAPSVAAGTSAQVTVTGTFSDGSTQNLTNSAMYNSSNPAVATVNGSGLITGTGPGISTITITVGGVTQTVTATATPATLVSVAITPTPPPSFAKGTRQTFVATGLFSDGSTQDLSSTVTWTTADPAVLTIDTHGVATGTGTGSASITAAYQGQTATTPAVQVTPAVVASIAVTPADRSVVAASTVQYTATATYTDATTQDVTSTATWSSSTLPVATVTPTGYAVALAAGATNISAQTGNLTGVTSLTVTPIVAPALVVLSVTPSTSTVAKGNTQQFTATGLFSDGSMQNLTSLATWQSSAPAVATVNNLGLATSVAGGNTQIWATYGAVQGVAALTVSAATLVTLTVTPATANLASGTSQQYRAVGTLSDGSTQDLTTSVNWTSSNAAIATINASGFASTLGIGSVTVTAQAGAISGTASLTVSSATVLSVQVIPAAVTLPAGGTQQLLVTAEFTDGSAQNVTTSVSYASANAGVATVDVTGKVLATGAGSSSLTVTLGSMTVTVPVVVTSAVLTSLAITPANLSLAAGQTQQMTATGTFSDGSTEDLTSTVLWLSSAPTIASVSLSGKVTMNQTGSVTLTATNGLTSASTSLTGTTAVVTAISVSPAAVTLATGQTRQFTATATLSNGTQQDVTSSAQWSTSDPTKGTVSNIAGLNGLLLATSAGNMSLKATLNSIIGSTTVTVTNAILTSLTVTPSPATVPAGATQQLSVTGIYSDGSTADVTTASTWTSNSTAIASVDSNGVLHAVAPGSTTVTAANGLISKGDLVTVTSAVLRSISITPVLPSIPLGVKTQLTATGTYSDGSTGDLTALVQWGSTSPAVATINSAGLANALSAGSTQITATLGSVAQQGPLTVTAAALVSIAVQASQSSFALGLSLPLQAIGTYSDSSTQNLTSLVTWSSQTPSVGVVSSSGLATGVTTGTFNARATLSGITGSLSLNVTSAVLQSITITPANQVILNLLGSQTQYTATGHFSDGSTLNITNTCHWAITAGLALGSISQTGSFSPIGVGAGTIAATSGSVSGSTGFVNISVL